MDQGPLVAEQIKAGADFVDRFHKVIPLLVAFWVKKGDGSDWELHIASDRFDENRVEPPAAAIVRILPPGSNPWLSPMEVRVDKVDSPMVREVRKIQEEYPELLPWRERTRMLGNTYVEYSYVYPIPSAVSG